MAVVWQSRTFANQSNGTSLTVNVPTGTVNGDLLLLVVSCPSTSNVNAPAGWNLINYTGTGNQDSTHIGQTIFWRKANSEPASYTITVDTANVYSLNIHRFTGQDPNSPIDSWSTNNGTGVNWTAASINTGAANTLLFYAGTTGNLNITGVTVATGYTERTSVADCVISLEQSTKAFVGPGATGNATAVAGQNATATDIWVAHLVAIAPPAPSATNIGEEWSDGPPIGKPIQWNRHAFLGWSAWMLPLDITGPAPVSNFIDIPTIDPRHSQIVFQGIVWPGVRDDNDPTYGMPENVFAVPPYRYRREHSFQGWTSDCIKFEYEMAKGVYWELPPTDPRRRHLHQGQAVPEFFLDAPIEIFDKWNTQLPVLDRKGTWSRHIRIWEGARGSPQAPDVTPANGYSYLPLVGVGNALPVIPNLNTLSLGFSTPGMDRWTRRPHTYYGWQSVRALLPADDINTYPVAPYSDLPIRRVKLVEPGWQQWTIEVPSVYMSMMTDVPVRRKVPAHQGWNWSLVEPNQYPGYRWTDIFFEKRPTGRNTLQRMPYLETQMVQGAVRPDAPILNQLSTPAIAAYSSRKLLASYSGSAFKIRRSSDSTTLDIGFTASGACDSAAITAFVGSNSAFIDTWYDQSGNGRNLTQAATAKQPRIVNAGTIDTMITSDPAPFFNGLAFYMQTASFTSSDPVTRCAVVGYISPTNTGPYTILDVSNAVKIQQLTVASGNLTMTEGTSATIATGLADHTLAAITSVCNGASSRWRYINTTGSGSTATASSLDGLTVGGSAAGGNPFNGNIGEVILFAADLPTTDQTTWHVNVHNYWSSP